MGRLRVHACLTVLCVATILLFHMDRVSPEKRSQIMARVRSKDTSPELVVRKILHARGFRFRLHRRDLPGRPDIVLPSRRTAIFVHGCFWHGHAGCSKGKLPKSNLEYWEPKIAANRKRDSSNVVALEGMGWTVRVIWQCQIENLKANQSSLDEMLLPLNTVEQRP